MLQPESTETPNGVPTTTAPGDTSEPGPIFTETEGAAPAPAAEPAVDERKERLASVKTLAAEIKAAAAERQRLAWERQRDAQMTQAMRAELDALQADPWGYVKAKHGLDARKVAEAELFEASDESAAMRAERLATEAKQQLDAVLTHARTQQEREQKIAQWEAAKATALKEYESKASTAFPDLDAWATRQASKTGQSKADIIVNELVHTVERLKKDERFAPYVAQYTDAELLAYMNERFDGYATAAKPKERSHKTLSADSTETKATAKEPFGSTAWRKREAAEIVEAWRRARGDRPVEEKPFTDHEIAEAEARVYGPEGRFNKDADKKHSAMLVHNAKLTAKARAR